MSSSNICVCGKHLVSARSSEESRINSRYFKHKEFNIENQFPRRRKSKKLNRGGETTQRCAASGNSQNLQSFRDKRSSDADAI